jgi:Zn-dependent M28 family amino/carboxypeptidase
MMKHFTTAMLALLLALGTALAASAGPPDCNTRVNDTPARLLECVTPEGVRAHLVALQAIAEANHGNRVSGASGYDASVAYVVQKLTEAGYQVTVQPFQFPTFILLGPSRLTQTAPGPAAYSEGRDYAVMAQSEPGEVRGAVTAVDLDFGPEGDGLGNRSTSGCQASDFAAFPAGHIALIQRGSCPFQLKAENAAAAGAVGVIIFNQGHTPDSTGLINGTLSANYTGGIPVLETTFARGLEWANRPELALQMKVNVLRGEATTYNILAETTAGRADNVIMLGAHLDSVNQGPGINDNGSGSAAILEVALQMARVKPVNKVRFAWWGAEESGLIGSTYYVANLSREERDQIALYLNFDMVGSPNFVRFVYDGDNSDTGRRGSNPAGSDTLEDFFLNYFDGQDLATTPTDIDHGSDHAAFRKADIPIGGLFSGAGGIKSAGQAAIYGGVAGQRYDSCYHLACDTLDNVNLEILHQNADAIAAATLHYAMSSAPVRGE